MKDNTIDNLPILVGKLNEYGINVCSITDYDVFYYNLYLELKKEEGKGSIQKVLPGVELSVEYDNGEINKVLHIVTLFDDENMEQIKQISKILNDSKDFQKYD